MGWLPEDQRDTRYYLWEPKFLCTMRYGDTISMEQLQSRGIYTTGDRELDRAAMNTPTNMYLSINDMVEYFKQGIVVGVKDRSQTKTIYEYISNHLAAFKREIMMAFTPNMEHIPVDDLILLDQFANAVYEYAKVQFNRDTANSMIARRIDELMSFNPQNVLGVEKVSHQVPSSAPEEEVDPYPKRDSLENYFVGLARGSRGVF